MRWGGAALEAALPPRSFAGDANEDLLPALVAFGAGPPVCLQSAKDLHAGGTQRMNGQGPATDSRTAERIHGGADVLER